MKRKEIFDSKYCTEMREIIKDDTKKIKKNRKTMIILSASLIASLACNICLFIDGYKTYNKCVALEETYSDLLFDNFVLERQLSLLKTNNKIYNDEIAELDKNIAEYEKQAEEQKKVIDDLMKEYDALMEENQILADLTSNSTNISTSSDFKSYMPKSSITARGTKQYKIVHNSVPDENGLLKYNGYYCVALGSAFGEVGELFKITLQNGNSFNVIKADEKADIHTINRMYSKDGSVIEFIVDSNTLNKTVKKLGNVGVLKKFNSPVQNIAKITTI